MKALLLYPEFSSYSFWNYKEVCELAGAKYPAAPLGMITMAALLPEDWELELVDLNTRTLAISQVDSADLVFIGGMLPQQNDFLKLIELAQSRGKRVVAGGPAPTSQPEVFGHADYVLLGETEVVMEEFLRDLRNGRPSGRYESQEFPDMTLSPIPRFDLLDFDDYLMVGVQFSRGCPFSCEFCDIIELYGRKPRTKTPQQIIKELDSLYRLGYRGHVDFVDDNFIGQRVKAREVLYALREWSEQRSFPFYYSTEASINLADDKEMLGLMRDLDFRYVFVGIETTDPDILKSTNKIQNVNRDFIADLHTFYEYGICVNGGFILGFDNETEKSARMITEVITRGKIGMAMIGLLYALPNTQLARRMERESRLLSDAHPQQRQLLKQSDIDQTTSGLNFITKRPREEILGDYVMILNDIYSCRNYFDRCLELGKAVDHRARHKPPFSAVMRMARGFFLTVVKLGFGRETSFLYWRNVFLILFARPGSLDTVVNMMAMYLHFRRQTAYLKSMLQANPPDPTAIP